MEIRQKFHIIALPSQNRQINVQITNAFWIHEDDQVAQSKNKSQSASNKLDVLRLHINFAILSKLAEKYL